MRVPKAISAIPVKLVTGRAGQFLFAAHLILFIYVWARKDWAWVQTLPPGHESLPYQIWLWLNLTAVVLTDLLMLALSLLPLGEDGILYSVSLWWINAFGLATVFIFASIQWLAVGLLVERFSRRAT